MYLIFDYFQQDLENTQLLTSKSINSLEIEIYLYRFITSLVFSYVLDLGHTQPAMFERSDSESK